MCSKFSMVVANHVRAPTGRPGVLRAFRVANLYPRCWSCLGSSISYRCLDAPLDVHHRVGLAALPPILVEMMLAGLEPPSKRPQPRAVSTSPPRTSLFNAPRQGASCGVRTVGDPSDSANHRILAVAVAHSTWNLLQTGSR